MVLDMSDARAMERLDDVDVSESNPLLAFLDRVERVPDAIARRKRSYELLGLRAGAKVADVGCGGGTAVREMAAYVSPGGSAVGVDVNEMLLEAASARAARAGVEVAFHMASAEALPFAPASLDGYRAERLFQHLPAPVKALAEARRVLAPGGRIVLVDQDWDGVLLDSEDLATTRLMLRTFCDGILNGTIGRQYQRLLSDVGFEDVKVYAEAIVSTSFDEYGFFPELAAQGAEARGAVDAAVAKAWLDDQRDRARRGRFFLTMTLLIATGRR